MNTLVLIFFSLIGYIIAYKLYGRYLADKIFSLSSKNKVPAHELRDNVDYVPTKKHILFGHHFTTIAGLGPIVGPAIGIIWGWLPAFLWVFFGSIFMGAVHDFSTLVISGRHKGKTIGELTGDLLGSSTRYVFQFIMQLLLLIVIAVFSMIVGVLFKMYPEVVIPVWLQIPLAVWLGKQISKGKNDLVYSIIAISFLYILVFVGMKFPVVIPELFGAGSDIVIWCIILFIYMFFASTIPVHKLLQPRDYINSNQLFIAIILLVIGFIVAHPPVYAPAINDLAFKKGSDVPGLMPLLFITIACGAISGFHSLASSGTTVKQINNEKDMLLVGFGSMLLEGFLAILVLMVIAGGLGMGLENNGVFYSGIDAFTFHYSSWSLASGLQAKLEAFVIGSANLLNSFGISFTYGKALIGVFIVSFANTTLDSATRIQRLSLQELFKLPDGSIRKPINNRYVATFLIIVAASLLTFAKPNAEGALVLWPLLGTLNQLLAALALLIITVYLVLKKKNYLIALIPMIFILVITIWAMIQNLLLFWRDKEIVLIIIAGLIFVLTVWLLISSVKALLNK